MIEIMRAIKRAIPELTEDELYLEAKKYIELCEKEAVKFVRDWTENYLRKLYIKKTIYPDLLKEAEDVYNMCWVEDPDYTEKRGIGK